MKDILSQHITLNQTIATQSSEKICVFCHFDNSGLISDYVVNYLTDLKNSGCDICFVSNSPNILPQQLDKIKPYVTQIVLRQNIGYDFAAYFTGYELVRPSFEKYKTIIFANDSVFGPFYSLAQVFNKMQAKNLDMWGISDSYAGRYHIQSYFWAFNLSPQIIEFLDSEVKNFTFLEKKEDIVETYEVGITQKLLAQDFKTGVLCPIEETTNFELWETKDETLLKLKEDIKTYAKTKITWGKKLKAFRSSKAARFYNFAHQDIHAYLTGINSSWYAGVKYFGLPFLKVSLLKSSGTFRFHRFAYVGVLKEKYPSFDINLIENHLKRTRKFTF